MLIRSYSVFYSYFCIHCGKTTKTRDVINFRSAESCGVCGKKRPYYAPRLRGFIKDGVMYRNLHVFIEGMPCRYHIGLGLYQTVYYLRSMSSDKDLVFDPSMTEPIKVDPDDLTSYIATGNYLAEK